MNCVRRFVLRGRSGQAATEYALIVALLIVGGVVLTRWLPDMLEAMNIYMMGIYYIVGTPLG